MCGFAGFLGAGLSQDSDSALLRQMNARIAHRGPDDSGVWLDVDAGVALGHRRLSILDLSPAGHQPMPSACGRYMLAFNGEIYNHLDLRKALELAGAAPAWRGHSDTETLLAGFAHWGLRHTLEQAVGMFALGVWDRERRVLTLARDRMGEKPLYYGWQRGVFLFGSELKALAAHPAFEAKIDRDAVAALMRFAYIPAPYSIYEGIAKLRPGHLLEVTLDGARAEPAAYWSAQAVVSQAKAAPTSDAEAVEGLHAELKRAVAGQMVADVPLGAFLSGGIDSSLIVALMQAQSARPVKTFTIGFDEAAFNEAEHAKAVAAHLGCEHTELYVRPEDSLEVIPHLPSLYDEPFADSSQIPTYLVSKLAREHVTVSLSGDAGDELFCGYNRYLMTNQLWHKISRLPAPLRVGAAKLIRAVPASAWNKGLSPLAGLLPAAWRHANVGDKLHKGAQVFGARSQTDLYGQLVSFWKDPASMVIGAVELPNVLNDGLMQRPPGDDFVEQMMAYDMGAYLPDDILVKVDRAAMAVSLETRVPFLDHRVVEHAWRMPQSLKLRDGQTKWALRQILFQYVPRELIERPKMGFGVPIDLWLRGPLRDWAENLLDEKRLREEGYFHPAPIRQAWQEHLSGKRNWPYHLWAVLMFQQWLESQRAALASVP